MNCEKKISAELKRVVEDMRNILKSEDPVEALNNYALALSKTVTYKLELSWGGPSDYLVFEYDPENKELVSISYYYLDWFDGARREIPYNSEEWKILEELFYTCILIE